MYHRRFRLLAAASVCVALALLSTPRPAQAEPPETVEITFGLKVPYDGMYPPDPILPYFVGEDTVAILFLDVPNAYTTEYFRIDSPAVGEFDDEEGQIEVAGTTWRTCAFATIVNAGGRPIEVAAAVRGAPNLPLHYPLLFDKITEVHTSWVGEDHNGRLCVQEFCSQWDLPTVAVYIIVKGEFRVTK